MDKEKRVAIEAELRSFYDNPISEAMSGDLAWWIVNIASGAITDDEIMSLVAIRDSLRADNARMKAENERMREYILAVSGDLEEMLDEDGMPIYDENIMGENIMSMAGMLQDALSQESTDESEPTDE